jgi:hypothetical protein
MRTSKLSASFLAVICTSIATYFQRDPLRLGRLELPCSSGNVCGNSRCGFLVINLHISSPEPPGSRRSLLPCRSLKRLSQQNLRLSDWSLKTGVASPSEGPFNSATARDAGNFISEVPFE